MAVSWIIRSDQYFQIRGLAVIALGILDGSILGSSPHFGGWEVWPGGSLDHPILPNGGLMRHLCTQMEYFRDTCVPI